MALYSQTQPQVTWIEPYETGWQLLGGQPATDLAPKLPHLGLADILFMSSVMHTSRDHRPWGIVTWLADVFCLSRPSLYALAQRVETRLLNPPLAVPLPAPVSPDIVVVTENRLIRTALTASLPGKAALRPTGEILQEAFGQTRSASWLNQLLGQAGAKAGHILRQVDTSPLQNVVVMRDETFVQGQPLLLIVEPVSSVILLAEVCHDRQADTWATALLMSQDRGATIRGLVEDMARMYPKSVKEAGLTAEAQKDCWHFQRDGGKALRDLERAAFRLTGEVVKLERQLLKKWDDTVFTERYIPAVVKEAMMYTYHACFAENLTHIADSLEIVDWRSGEIRDPADNEWLFNEAVAAMSAVDHPSAKRWLKTARREQKRLFTGLRWLNAALPAYRQQLDPVVAPEEQETFMRLVARHWRLQQALINGQRHFRPEALAAEAALDHFVGGDENKWQLVEALVALLNATCRASSMIENVNGLLKAFLHNHRAFSSPETLQQYLNLFVLWHNMRVFKRGKRQGKSPYQWAGIDMGTDDWLTLLGYPAI
jgi:hypothetical protein